MPNDHYYTAEPASAHKPGSVSFPYRGCALTFETDSGVFSRTELDRGTEVLLEALPDDLGGSVLDMGCGYGAIGVAVGKAFVGCRITMADINRRAVGLAEQNASRNGVSARALESDGYASLPDERYDLILQNPPIRAGKAVIYRMFADAARFLAPCGSLWLVIRKQQGAPSAIAYLRTLYESVETPEKKSGFWIIRCQQPKNTKETDL